MTSPVYSALPQEPLLDVDPMRPGMNIFCLNEKLGIYQHQMQNDKQSKCAKCYFTGDMNAT